MWKYFDATQKPQLILLVCTQMRIPVDVIGLCNDLDLLDLIHFASIAEIQQHAITINPTSLRVYMCMHPKILIIV